MKALVLALFLTIAAKPVAAPPAPKPVTIYGFQQCGKFIFVLFVASDGTNRLVDFDDSDALRAIILQVPEDQRFKVTLEGPVNGCPLTT